MKHLIYLLLFIPTASYSQNWNSNLVTSEATYRILQYDTVPAILFYADFSNKGQSNGIVMWRKGFVIQETSRDLNTWEVRELFIYFDENKQIIKDGIIVISHRKY